MQRAESQLIVAFACADESVIGLTAAFYMACDQTVPQVLMHITRLKNAGAIIGSVNAGETVRCDQIGDKDLYCAPEELQLLTPYVMLTTGADKPWGKVMTWPDAFSRQ